MSGADEELAGQVREIVATQERLAAAVESLAYKKSHVKQEAVAAAQVKADQLLEKAEDKKDELVGRILDKIPSRGEISQSGERVLGEVVEKVEGLRDQAAEGLRHAGSSVETTLAQRVAQIKGAAASAVLAEQSGTGSAAETEPQAEEISQGG